MKVAFMIPITSRGKNWKSINESYLITSTLKTFIETKSDNIEYGFYLGFDSDDPLFSKEINIILLEKLFEKINVKLNITKYMNIPKGHLTIMWNILYKKAYDDNYDYFYQCGDDIIFKNKNWINETINMLKKNNDIGVSGPKNWDRDILTQTMVSRKHYEIFGFLFPESIINWYCDDWLSNVYKPNYYTVVSDNIAENICTHGRYPIINNTDNYKIELEKGKNILNQIINKFT